MAGALLLALALTWVAPLPAVADTGECSAPGKEIALTLAAVLANVVYLPAKLTYAAVGGVSGIFAYGLTLGSIETMTAIWVPSLGGDYLLTKDMVSGDEPVFFVGRGDPG